MKVSSTGGGGNRLSDLQPPSSGDLLQAVSAQPLYGLGSLQAMHIPGLTSSSQATPLHVPQIHRCSKRAWREARNPETKLELGKSPPQVNKGSRTLGRHPLAWKAEAPMLEENPRSQDYAILFSLTNQGLCEPFQPLHPRRQEGSGSSPHAFSGAHTNTRTLAHASRCYGGPVASQAEGAGLLLQA